jgi:hypothetical protein
MAPPCLPPGLIEVTIAPGGVLVEIRDPIAVRAVRDRLKVELEELDRLGESMAAIELNAAIEALNKRLGEETSAIDIAKLKQRHFRN